MKIAYDLKGDVKNFSRDIIGLQCSRGTTTKDLSRKQEQIVGETLALYNILTVFYGIPVFGANSKIYTATIWSQFKCIIDL